MKTSLTASILINGLCASAALAGPGVSGGGASVVCRDKQHTITSARFYDLYAAENDTRHPMIVIRSNEPMAKQIGSALARWMKPVIDSADPQLTVSYDVSLLRRGLGLVARDWQPIAAGTRLPFLPDVSPEVLPGDASCGLETTAHYDDAANVLRVDMAIYSRLSATDQAALRVHEAVYKVKRVFSSAKDSQGTRQMVARLFSRARPGKPALRVPGFERGLLDLSSNSSEIDEITDPSLPQAQLDLFLGGKSLVCVSAKDATQKVALRLERDSGDESDDRLYLHSAAASTLGWLSEDALNLGDSKLERLLVPETSDDYEDFAVLRVGETDAFRLAFKFQDLLEDDAYRSGKTAVGIYSLANERGAGDIEGMPVSCTLR